MRLSDWKCINLPSSHEMDNELEVALTRTILETRLGRGAVEVVNVAKLKAEAPAGDKL